ncbi:hypothetical protein GCM10009850_064000 [Nonomuraea monospora]|uniref:DUF4365 domain-containing protein n=1 Tax=Nonomuraea monospora TaxID=568818 RepID=A0ABN3CNF6_9ACTN
MPSPRHDTPWVQQEERTSNTRKSDDIEADLVLTMGPPHGEAEHAIIVEVQQGKGKNPRQLARYAAALWLMLDCPVSVLVICPDRADAAFYAQPIDTDLPGYRPQPYVLGPDDVPAFTNPQEAATRLDLAAMSVMAHGRDRKVVEAFTSALRHADDEHATKYNEYAYSIAGPEVRRLLEEIMASTDWPVYSPFAREHFGRGVQEGNANEASRALLLVLEARGFLITDDLRAELTACTDLALLEAWIRRAATAKTSDNLFHELD